MKLGIDSVEGCAMMQSICVRESPEGTLWVSIISGIFNCWLAVLRNTTSMISNYTMGPHFGLIVISPHFRQDQINRSPASNYAAVILCYR